jgi:hypothetical protein
LQVANAAATYLTKNNPVVTGTLTANGSTGTSGYYLRTSGTGVYWSPVAASGATWSALTTTNTALRTLISDRLQVANAASIYQTKTVERAALANTNSYIATKASWAALTSTNTAIRALDAQKLSVANAVSTYATKSNPVTSGLLAHTGRATISTNLNVSGNTTIVGLNANGSIGTSGQVLKTNGTSVYWGTGGSSTTGANATVTRVKISNLNVNSFVVTSVTGAVVNPNTVITLTTKTLDSIKGTDTVVTGVQTTSGLNYLQVANAKSQLANTNSYIATQATRITLVNTNLTGTNTALRTLINDRLQVANAATTYQTKSVERAALANTNARINLLNTNLTATNTAIRALDTAKLSVANAVATYATKSNPITSGLLAHTGRATISTNLAVTGNSSITGTETVTGLFTASGRATVGTNLTVSGNTVLGAAGKTANVTGWFGVAGRQSISTNLFVGGNTAINGLVNINYTGSANASLAIRGTNTKGGAGYHDFLVVRNGGGGVTNPTKWFRTNVTGGLEIINDAYTSVILSLSNAGDLVTTGNVTAYSDEKLKTDITTIENALALVEQMRGVRYNRIEDGKAGVGVVAQEMQQVLPEVVLEGDNLSVAYGNLVGVLIEAVKELSARVKELEAK